jgi:hypothetical protein
VDVVFILAHAATEGQVLEKVEQELVLPNVFLEVREVLVLFESKGLAKVIA